MLGGSVSQARPVNVCTGKATSPTSGNVGTLWEHGTMANLRSKLANLDLFGPTGSVAPDICACMPCPVLSAFPTSPFPPPPLRWVQ